MRQQLTWPDPAFCWTRKVGGSDAAAADGCGAGVVPYPFTPRHAGGPTGTEAAGFFTQLSRRYSGIPPPSSSTPNSASLCHPTHVFPCLSCPGPIPSLPKDRFPSLTYSLAWRTIESMEGLAYSDGLEGSRIRGRHPSSEGQQICYPDSQPRPPV